MTIAEDNVRKIHVDASLPLSQDTLWMSQIAFSPLPDGYATFVKDLKATDDQGNQVSLIPVGKGIWKVDAPTPLNIRLQYDVAIGHDTVNWSVSAAFARAYVADKIVFFTGRTMFIAPKHGAYSKIQVHFILPEGWDIATPYTHEENNKDVYQVNTLSDLWDNGNFAGSFVKEEIHIGELQIIIAGTSSMRDGVGLFKSALTKISNAYASDMGGTPQGRFVIMGSVAPLITGGETFKNSISLIFSQPPDMDNKDNWAYLLSHEVFHLWNGEAITALDQSQVEWFVEGFTDYMSNLTAFKTGLTTEIELFHKIAISCDTYLKSAGSISMTQAGAAKGINYGLIYQGGMTVALALEITTRRATKNKKGLAEIMKAMYTDFGIGHKLFTYDDVIHESSRVAGIDLSGFFATYVSGIQVIPLQEYLGYAGLQIIRQDGETVIVHNPHASQEETGLLKAILSETK